MYDMFQSEGVKNFEEISDLSRDLFFYYKIKTVITD